MEIPEWHWQMQEHNHQFYCELWYELDQKNYDFETIKKALDDNNHYIRLGKDPVETSVIVANDIESKRKN